MQISQLHYKPAGPRALQTVIKGGNAANVWSSMEPPAAIHFLLAVANPIGKTIMGYLAVRRPDIANKWKKKLNKGNVAGEGRKRSAGLLRAVKYLLKIIANSIKYKSNNNVFLGTTGVFLTYLHIYTTVAKNTQILQFRESVGSQHNIHVHFKRQLTWMIGISTLHLTNTISTLVNFGCFKSA